MIPPMPTRRSFNLGLALLVASIVAPSVARAQGAHWDDAPDDDPAGDELVPYDDRDPAALTDFNAELAPHGAWRDDPTYGRVWLPHRSVVGPDFAPYVTSGHWAVASDGGWIWVSDYPWGWVVFHYGRWVWIAGVGWAWVPGRQYAHAWVTWRVADPGWAYVGWAPMPPDYVWFDGVAVGVWFGFYTPWVFCPSAYIYHSHLHGYIVHDHYHVHRIAAHSHRYVPPRGAPSWAGPPPRQAHVPAKAIPKTHAPAHPKAVAASRQKASERNAKVITPGGRSYDGAGARRVPDRRPASRTLPGTSNEPLRSYRQPSGPGGPSRVEPGYRAPSAGQRSAPSPYRAEPRYPSRSPSPSRAAPSRSESSPPSAAPSRPSQPSYRSSPPRTSPAPAPSYRPPAPAPAPAHPGRPGRRR